MWRSNTPVLLTRQDLEQLELSILAPYAVKNIESQGRAYPEEKDPYRLDFARDRDRIVHSHAFRRLREKTQVFVANYGDHYRNRLTHTMEVAEFGRDIAKNLKLNEDLAESIALAHDLGHTPFGHSGENVMDSIMQEYGEHFEHNEQSKRVVEFLEKKSPDYKGLNLTYEVRDGLMKHRSFYDQQGITLENNASLEAQVVNIADEIAYQSHDLEDGIRSGILNFEKLKKVALWNMVLESIPKDFPVKEYFSDVISKITKMMIEDLYQTTSQNIEKQNIQTLEDVYQAKEPIVLYSENFSPLNKELKDFLYENMYFHPKILRQSKRGAEIIEFLFRDYMKHPLEQLKEKVTDDNPLHIVVKDYIAGMTDEYAKKQFQS